MTVTLTAAAGAIAIGAGLWVLSGGRRRGECSICIGGGAK